MTHPTRRNQGGEQLRIWMNDRAMSRSKMASLIGVSPSTVTHYVAGRCRPSFERAAIIEKITNVQVKSWAEILS